MMRRPNRLASSVVLCPSLILLTAALASAQSGLIWPRPPAEPMVGLQSVMSRLRGFEVAVQGPTEGALPRVQRLRRPSGVDFDSAGRLLISDSRQGLLLRIDPDLGVVLVFGSATQPSLRTPLGIATHADGTIYVADAGLRQVVAFDGQGEVTGVYGSGNLDEPTDVALSPDGERLYVVDTRADRIAVFDRGDRREIDSLGGRGIGVGEFAAPTAVAFDRSGNLLIVDQLNARVQIFDPSGAFKSALYLGRSGRLGRPQDVATDASGRVYVTDQARSLVQIYDTDLDPLLNFGRNGLGPGEFLAVGSVAVRGDRMAVLDPAGGRVQLFSLYGVQTPAEPRRAADTAAEAAPVEEPEPVEEPDPAPAAAAAVAEPAVEAEPAAPPVESVPDVTELAARIEADTPPAEGAAREPEAPDESLDAARVAQELVDLVKAWAAAWSAQDVDGYLSFYSGTFEPSDGSSRERWSARRRARVSAPSSIEVEVEILETRLEGDTAQVVLLQSYTSDRFADRVRKQLRLVRGEDGWSIDRETVLETL